MDKEFKAGKKYRVTLSHKFEGEYVETIKEGQLEFAIFTTGGSGRHGPHYRKVLLSTIIDSELTKT